MLLVSIDARPGGARTAQSLSVEFPGDELLDQDVEWCRITIGGETRKIGFSYYDEIYAIPGLYELLFYERLKCCSPQVVRELLEKELDDEEVDPRSRRSLDLGARN